MNVAPSLRSVLTGSIVALALVSLLVGASLVIVTNALNRVSRSLSDSVESIRLTHGAEVGLLAHARIQDPVVRSRIGTSVRHRLAQARAFAQAGPELQVLRQSTDAVEGYLATSERGPANPEEIGRRLKSAFRSTEELARINSAQSQEAREEARDLTSLAVRISLAAGLVLFVVVTLVLWWLNGKAFRPSFALASAMRRFATGSWDARAPETGPLELAQMAAQFNQMADRIADQRTAQAGFLAGVAHDLRTPLSALQMSVGIIDSHRPLPPEDQIRKTIAVVGRQVDRLQRMIEDLLDKARIEAGELVLSIGEHDVRALISHTVELFEDISSQHRLELELPDAPIYAACDPGRIEQVLNNLVSNAVKYSPAGGEVRISVAVDGARVRISVTDQGIGIAAEDVPRLFEPFRRVRAPGQPASGAGLGLFVSKRIVEAHRGTIEVHSVRGEGSTFTVSLPLVRQSQQAA